MNRRRGFTLIELLIVIAIIAVLITILAPALQSAKELATAAVCQGNQRVLINAWIAYHQDNKNWLVGGCNYTDDWSKHRWVEPPKKTPVYGGDPPAWPNNDYVNDTNVTQTYRENGMRAGKLYKYTQNVEAYHCPGDDRINKPPPYDLFQTYSITGAMRGEDVQVGHNGVLAYSKASTIKYPEEKFVFVEEGVQNQWYNSGSWMIRITDPVDPQTTQWIDPLAIFHNRRSTFAFADGHVNLKVFVDDRTFEFSEKGDGLWDTGPIEPDNKDLQWLAYGYGGLPLP